MYLLRGLLRCGACGSFLTPKRSLGRGGKPHFYYERSKRNHTSRTGCDAKYVLAELRKWSLSDDETRRAVQAVEAGGDSRARTDRLNEIEAEEREPARIATEREYIRQNTPSAELMTAAYRAVPAMIDRLTAAGEWHALNDLIARYVEVIDRHQDAGDPTAGTAEVVLFEEAMAGRELANDKAPDAASVHRRCVGSPGRLPR